METIFYYVKTGKILSKDEVSALMSGYAAPTGTIAVSYTHLRAHET